MTRYRVGWDQVLAMFLLGTSAIASGANIDDKAAIAQSVDCLHTLDGMNEGRQWAQLRITGREVRVLVQSGGEDWVFVELTCSRDGVAEGARWKLPERVTGKGSLPAEPMLARRSFDAARLRSLMDSAHRHADLRDGQLVEFSASYVNQPRHTTVYSATFRDGDYTVSTEFDDGGAVEKGTALDRDELADAGEPPQEGADLHLEKLTQDTVKVADYLAGAIGGATKINRFIVDPNMLTVEWVSPTKHGVQLQQWVTNEGRLFAPDEATPPNVNKVCANQPTVAQVKTSLGRLVAQPAREKRIRQSAMLILECEKPGGEMKWWLLGGDGVMKEGVALASERFPF